MKMTHLISFFTEITDMQRLMFAVAVVLIFWQIETLIAFKQNPNRWSHLWHNALYIVPDTLVQVAIGVFFIETINFNQSHHWGLLFLLGIKNPVAIFIVSFLMLDFCEWVYHWLTHKVPFFWRFHLVHHSDPIVDVTTTVREHPGETVLRLGFTTLWVFLTGAPLWAYFFRQFFQITCNFWCHSNFVLPEKIDKYAGLVFNTPHLHHIHHHYRQPYTDTNYADVLIIWDRLFGTYARMNKEDLIYGLETYPDVDTNWQFQTSVALPFKTLIYPEDLLQEQAVEAYNTEGALSSSNINFNKQ